MRLRIFGAVSDLIFAVNSPALLTLFICQPWPPSTHPGVINSGHLQRPNWAEKKSVVPTAQKDGGQLQVSEALFVIFQLHIAK